jgi:hypothetical protein
MLHYLTHTEIDQQKWDSCIKGSVNGLPYAYSWWLNIVSQGWDAVIKDDYLAVMPITRKKKYGLYYLIQPKFSQQLGIFYTQPLTIEETNQFFSLIPAKFRYINIHVQEPAQPDQQGFNFQLRSNYLLDLTPDYISLLSNYHRNCRRNLQKAVHAGLRVKPVLLPSVFASFVQKKLEGQLKGSFENIFSLLKNLVTESLSHKCSEILGVYKPGGEMLAAGWFVFSNNRCLFMVCASTSEGKKNQAMYFLVDHMIRSKAGTGLKFDFTGSNMPGIAYFNSGFGAIKTTYLAVKRNLLPWPLRMFK